MTGEPLQQYFFHRGEETFPMIEGETRIGSDPSCDVVVEGEKVEAVHAAAVIRDDQVILQDRSTEGTVRINGIPARSAELTDGEKVRFGKMRLEVEKSAGSCVLVGKEGRNPLRPGENRVGRGPEATLSLDDPSVSREHALVVILPSGQAWVRDLGSSNGTWVGDRRLGEWPLSSGDKVEIGGEKLTFRAVDLPPEAVEEENEENQAYAATQLVPTGDESPPELVVDGEPRFLDEGRLVVGRTPECDVSFTDDPSVSREHAELVVAGNRVVIQDLGSSNGTYVNKERIRTSTVLRDGDRVEIGGHVLEVRIPDPVSPYGSTQLISTLSGEIGEEPAVPGTPTPRESEAPPALAGLDPEDRRAYELLDLEPPADEATVRKRYRERYSDLQIRLDNAPTPELKETYRKKIEALKEAASRLAPGVLAAPDAESLPSAEPVDRTSAWVSSPTPEGGEADLPPPPPPPEAPEPSEKKAKKGKRKREKAEGEEASIPGSTILMAVLALLVMVATGVFFYLYREAAAVEEDLRNQLTERLETIQGLEERIPALEEALEELQESKARLLENEELKICNLSSREVTIRWLNATYVDPTGRFETFDTAWNQVGWDKWTIPSDGSWSGQVIRGTQTIWDGSAVFYSVLLVHRGEEIFRAGATPTLGGECYSVDLG